MTSNNTEINQDIQQPPDVRGLLRYHEISLLMVADRADCNVLTATRVLDPSSALRSIMAHSIATREAVSRLLKEAGCKVDLSASWAALDVAIKDQWKLAA